MWDPDVEGLKGAGAGAPLTWEEACELVNTWNRQHSTESLLQAVNPDQNRPRHPSRNAYSRFYDGKEDSEKSEDDSSTEVEGILQISDLLKVLSPVILIKRY